MEELPLSASFILSSFRFRLPSPLIHAHTAFFKEKNINLSKSRLTSRNAPRYPTNEIESFALHKIPESTK